MPNLNVLQRAEIILLDYSGTLSDDRDLVYEANQRLLERHGESRLTVAEWRDGRPGWNAGNFLAEKYGYGERDLRGLYDEFAEQLASVKTEIGAPRLYPGAIEFVTELGDKRKRIEIISSHPQAHLDEEIGLNGLGHLVKKALGSVSNKVLEIGASLERGGYGSEEAVYIGDTVEDLRAAHQSMIGAVAVTYGYQSKERLQAEDPDLIADSLRSLSAYL